MALKMTDTLNDDKYKHITFQDSLNIWQHIIQKCINTNDGINKPTIIEQPNLTYLPQIINQYTYYHTKNSNVSPMYTIVQMLGAMNCTTRGYFLVNNGSFSIPANAFIVQAADPGYGKSHLNKPFKDTIIKFQNEYNESIKNDLAREKYEKKRISLKINEIDKKLLKCTDNYEYENHIREIAELYQQKDNLRTYELEIFADDITIPALMKLMHNQRGRIAIMNSELGALRHLTTANSNSNYCEKFLRLFNGDDVRFTRKTGEKIIMDNPILALYIATQIEPLRDLLSNLYVISSGMSSRILLSIADDRNIGFRNFENIESYPDIQNSYNSLIHKILHRIQTSKTQNETLFFDIIAQQEFIEIRHSIEKDIRPGGEFSPISEWAKKLCNHISTISAFLHLHKHPVGNSTISHKTLKTAVIIAYWLAQNMLSFNNFAFPTKSKDFPFIIGKKIYDKKLSFFTPRDITRLFSNVNTGDVKFALSTLINYGGISIIQEKQKNGPGRPSGETYSTNFIILYNILNSYYYR